jgi:hypothetical protein
MKPAPESLLFSPQITPEGIVSTLAGCGKEGHWDGPAADAMFSSPAGLAVDLLGNILVSDVHNHCIRMITPQGVVSTLAGNYVFEYLDSPLKARSRFHSRAPN